jgi:hypothetical protein
MAREKPGLGWAYTRIRGALGNLGHDIGRNTIKHILLGRQHGSRPRAKWAHVVERLLARALGRVAAIDVFTVEAVTLAGLIRYHVLFVIAWPVVASTSRVLFTNRARLG